MKLLLTINNCSFDKIPYFLRQFLDWHLHLDRSLPAPLDAVGSWLHEAEGALREELVVQHAHEVTAPTFHNAIEQHKVCWSHSLLSCIKASV